MWWKKAPKVNPENGMFTVLNAGKFISEFECHIRRELENEILNLGDITTEETLPSIFDRMQELAVRSVKVALAEHGTPSKICPRCMRESR